LCFLTSSGNAIRGVSFGAGNAVGRRKREISLQEDANPGRFEIPRVRAPKRKSWQARKQRPDKFTQSRPYVTTTKKPPITKIQPKYSSVVTNFNLPLKITFVLCFWIKTETRFAQLISVTEKLPDNKPDVSVKFGRWLIYYPSWKQPKQNTNDKQKNIINVSIVQRMLTLELGYKRTKRLVYCIDTGYKIFFQICQGLF
jgi:hypothetical protein